MRDDVKMQRRLLLVEPIPRMTPVHPIPLQQNTIDSPYIAVQSNTVSDTSSQQQRRNVGWATGCLCWFMYFFYKGGTFIQLSSNRCRAWPAFKINKNPSYLVVIYELYVQCEHMCYVVKWRRVRYMLTWAGHNRWHASWLSGGRHVNRNDVMAYLTCPNI